MSVPETERLAAARARLVADVISLRATHDAIVDSRDQAGTDDEHDPDGSTLAFERAQVASLLRETLDQLLALDAAEARLRAGTYGTCEACGSPIGSERLAARPTATQCVSSAAAGARRLL